LPHDKLTEKQEPHLISGSKTGETIYNHDAIFNSFSNFFWGLMGTKAPSFDIRVNWEQLYPIEARTTLLELEEPFTEEEISGSVFPLGLYKAPDPDGFNIRFYQHF